MNPDELTKPDQHGEPDSFQQAWRAQSATTRVTIDSDRLRKEVERSQRDFRSTIFWRDFREIAVGLFLLPVDFYLGIKFALPWTWWLSVPAVLWIIGFMLVDRRLHKQAPSEPGSPMLTSATESLRQLEHQIWLLRNVFWWYLLPFIISSFAFFAQTAWSTWVPTGEWWDSLAHAASAIFFFMFLCVVVGGVFVFVYWLNQYAVRTQLEPRRNELRSLIAGLRDEPATEVSGEYPILLSGKSIGCSRRRTIFANVVTVLVALVVLGGIVLLPSFLGNMPAFSEKSPFAGVRWDQAQPEVKVDDKWFKLVSLDDLSTSEIIAFSKQTYGDKWQKRFEEDLVALLTRMGHQPRDTVTLVVQSLTSPETRTLENVPMTRANRKAIWDAAQARERDRK